MRFVATCPWRMPGRDLGACKGVAEGGLLTAGGCIESVVTCLCWMERGIVMAENKWEVKETMGGK